jgi:hypothetical protein
MRRSGSIEVDSNVKGLFHEDQPETGTSGNAGTQREMALNPWVLKCHRTQLKELMTSIHADSSERSILLLSCRSNHVTIYSYFKGTSQLLLAITDTVESSILGA